MTAAEQGANGSELPPPPPAVPPGVTPIKEEELELTKKSPNPKWLPIARRGKGSRGQKIQLLTNHFQVRMPNSDGFFYHYSVKITYEDGHDVDVKGVGRKVLAKVHETYETELAGKKFAYDGEKSLFTLGALPHNKLEFTVVLEDQQSSRAGGGGSPGGSPNDGERKRVRRPQRSKTYKVEISYAAKIPLQAITNALRGQDSENFQEAVRVLDIILRQHAAMQGCLLVRQSFFQNEPRNFTSIGGGVLGCRGFHSSFRPTQGGLSLNIDVSTTMIVRPGPVVDFLVENQNVRDPSQIDWIKAKRMLKNLRITVQPSNTEYKITGLSEQTCRDQLFEWRQRNGDGEYQSVEITVLDYFVNHRNIDLRFSADLPCINVGKPKKPAYFPVELCSLVSLQRYTRALSGMQRASLVEKSRQKPQERMKVLTDALRSSNYGSDPMLQSSGISINNQFARVEGRVLSAPKLRVGSGEDFFPRHGRWNFNNKTLFEPTKPLREWAIVNFSARCDTNMLVRDIMKCGDRKGMSISEPWPTIFMENQQDRRLPPSARVEQMIAAVMSGLPRVPQLLLCILPERKNCDLYGPWKRRNLADLGVITQCIAPTRLNDQYLTNVLLKINAKLGGLNSMLTIENNKSIPLVSCIPTLIIGMDVSHGSPGRADVPSIAAVVSSRGWPSISRYRASVRTQSAKVEMIDALFKPGEKNRDDGMIREALVDFFVSSGKRKPEQIVIFRDGVSESQFVQVLNLELEKIKEACKFLEEEWSPKFAFIVAQKNHHTKFFQDNNSPDNVPPGTVVDNSVCHPKNYDFYMCAHAGMIGTTRPTHYHVLYDEIGFSADDLQELVHSLSYVYQRSTTAISVVSPICYAHLAASQVGQFMKFDDFSDTSSSHSGVTSAGPASVPPLPTLHERVSSTMFFC